MNKAVFLDRDGTMIEDVDYLDHIDQLKVLDGAYAAVAAMRKLGYKILVVTNQSGIARGFLTVEYLEKIHARLAEMFAQTGAGFDDLIYCPFHADGKLPEFARESSMRKPAPGMLLELAAKHDVDLTRSFMVGDKPCDVAAGKAAGCYSIRIDSKPDEQADCTAKDLLEALEFIQSVENEG